jgi:hypothetical protein
MFSLPEDARNGVRTLYEYWCSITPPGRLPGRQHFDPLDVPTLLPNLWLVEVHRNPLRFFYRLVGSRIEEFAGERLTGLWFAQRLSGPALQQVNMAMQAVIENREPSWRRGKPRIRWEKDHMTIERLYLPLAANGVDVDMILAITELDYSTSSDLVTGARHHETSTQTVNAARQVEYARPSRRMPAYGAVPWPSWKVDGMKSFTEPSRFASQ